MIDHPFTMEQPPSPEEKESRHAADHFFSLRAQRASVQNTENLSRRAEMLMQQAEAYAGELAQAGVSKLQVWEDLRKGWLCVSSV